MSTEAQAEDTANDDPVISVCKQLQGNGRPTLKLLSDMALGSKSRPGGLSLSEIKYVLQHAMENNDAGVIEMASLAYIIKQSAAAGHDSISYVGIGRNPANLIIRDCLLVRFGVRVYSYRPAAGTASLKRWDERLHTILRHPSGVVEFNSLVAQRILMKVGPAWNISTESITVAALREVQFLAIFAEGALCPDNTKLDTTFDDNSYAHIPATVSLTRDTGEPVVRLAGDPLWDAIASGVVDIHPNRIHSSLIEMASRKMV